MVKPRSIIAFLITLILFLLISLPAFAGNLQSQVENSIVCPACIDEGMTVGTCGDSTAAQVRGDIRNKISQGMTKQEIINFYLDKYGEIILAVPTKSGFNLTAWVTPFVALTLAAFIIYRALNQWVGNNKPALANSNAEITYDDEYDELLEDEIKKYFK